MRRPITFSESYYENAEKLAKMLHERGKILWMNGPLYPEIQRYADGIMAEGHAGTSEVLKILTLDKPLLVHQYPETPRHVELIFGYAMRAGAWLYSIGASSRLADPPPITPEARAIFESCAELLKPLKGRKWCFEPDPVHFPDGICGNIFHGADGESLIVTAVSWSGLFTDALKERIKIKLNLPDMENEFNAYYRSTRHGEWKRAEFAYPEIILPEHMGMSTVVITRKTTVPE